VLTIHVNSGGRAEVETDLLEAAVLSVLDAEGVESGEVSITLLDDASIQEMNRDYLGHDRPTDVISFALHGTGEPLLGDVYIGFDQAVRQAVQEEVQAREELARLAIHGTLHVLGYDHPDDETRTASAMFRRQEELVGELFAGGGGSEDQPPNRSKPVTEPGAPDRNRIGNDLEALIAAGDARAIQDALAGLHPSDVADLVESLEDDEKRLFVIRQLPEEQASETLAEMEEAEHPAELLAALGPVKGAALVHELEIDDAADLMGELEPEERDKDDRRRGHRRSAPPGPGGG
jgi:probable rRNA maturation factor